MEHGHRKVNAGNPLSVERNVFSRTEVRDDLLRSSRSAAFVTVLFLLPVSRAANHYDPSWGPEPPVPPHGMNPLPNSRVVEPLIFPVLANCKWNDDYSCNRGGFLHAAIDIRAPKMSPIVAPFSGVIGIKTESFWIYGDDGWAMLGTHLNDDDLGKHDRAGGKDVMFAPNLVGGQHVYAGQFIGYVGMSGNATGPHLHFELYAPGSGPTAPRVRNPFLSLKDAQVILQPRISLAGKRPGKGEIRVDGCVRRVDPVHGKLTLILFAKETEKGKTSAVLGPHYVRLSLPKRVIDRAGGWGALGSLRDSTPVSCYLAASSRLDDQRVGRLLLNVGTTR